MTLSASSSIPSASRSSFGSASNVTSHASSSSSKPSSSIPTPPSKKSGSRNRPIVLVDLSDEEDDEKVLKELQQYSTYKLHRKADDEVPYKRQVDRGDPDFVKEREAKRVKREGYKSYKSKIPDKDIEEDDQIPKLPPVEYHPVAAMPDEPTLTPQQNEILERILKGENFFFTGSAGTGKSVLLRAIVKAFKERYKGPRGDSLEKGRVEKWKLAITASTGMAAINIGGCTLHSWSGIGTGVEPVGKLIQKVYGFPPSRGNWQTTAALLIDEISMIDGKLIDKLDSIGRALRGNQKPFGGLQVILSGDFHQLPPVAKRGEAPYVFAFEATSWKSIIPNSQMACLNRVFRQREGDFVKMLEDMRKGNVSNAAETQLRKLARPLTYPDGIAPIELYSSLAEVKAVNDGELAKLQSQPFTYTARDHPGTYASGRQVEPHDAVRMLNDNTRWPQEVTLKVGAVVMLVTNIPRSPLVNGSVGKIVAFMTCPEAIASGAQNATDWYTGGPDKIWPVIEFIPSKYATQPLAKRVIVPELSIQILNGAGEIQTSRNQVPLILACITIHKSQGQTLERVKIDLGRVFAEGQSYVAISRAVSMEDLELHNFARSKVKVNDRVLRWAARLEKASSP